MTRKDYVLIAGALRSTRPPVDLMPNDGPAAFTAWADTVSSVTVALAFDNPDFNQEVFLEACGLPEEAF